jgi:hypothetical protein
MDDLTDTPALSESWSFTLPWAELEIFPHDAPVLPELLRDVAAVLPHLEPRFRPALLRFTRLGSGRPHPYLVVWPPGRTLPEPAPGAQETLDALEDVVLAELCTHRCFVCGARVRTVYPDGALGVRGRHYDAHRLLSGCTACGADFSTSRIQGLALLAC